MNIENRWGNVAVGILAGLGAAGVFLVIAAVLK